MGHAKLQANVDLYNVAHSDAALTVNNTYGSAASNQWLTPTSVMGARILEIGGNFTF